MTDNESWKTLATDLLNLVLGDFEWVRAQGGRHSVCPLCHATCERDGGPGHQDDCPRLDYVKRFDALRACADALAPSPEKMQETNTDTRGGTPEISPRLQSSAPTDEVISTTAPNEHPTCDSCVHLTAFELSDDLFTCPVVNIRIHRESAAIFGCNQHEAK